MLEKIIFYFQYPIVQRAFIVGTLIAISSALLGVILVLKRFSFIGDGLSHVAFGAMCIAGILNFSNNMYLILPVTIIAAILLLRTGQETKIKGDAAVAMISVGALAIGYLLKSLFSTSANISGDVCTTLFSSAAILNLNETDVILCSSLSICVIIAFIVFYNKIFAVTFDEKFAKAVGTHASVYNLVIAIIIAIIIVLAMKLVGSLLVSALIIFPSLSAMRVFKSFKAVTICSAVFSVVASSIGIILSITVTNLLGPSIVAVDIFGFLVFSLIGAIRK